MNPSNFFKDSGKRTALYCAILFFFIIAAFVILKSARDALFLSRYSSRLLPYLMAVNTAGAALLVGLSYRFSNSVSFRLGTKLTYISLITGSMLAWFGIAYEIPGATFILFLWVGIVGTIAPAHVWSLANYTLSVRQARRWLAFIGAGATVGDIAGGLIARSISLHWDVALLLPVASILIVAAALFAILLSSTVDENSAPPQPESVSDNRGSLVLFTLIVVGSVTLVSNFVDLQMKTISQQEFRTANRLGVFFGSFHAQVGFYTLIFQLFFTQTLMKRLSMASTLSLLPGTLLIGNGLLLISPSLASAVFAKGSEQLLGNSVNRSSMELLYMAVPDREKLRTKFFIQTVGVRTAEAIAAIILILLFSIGNLPIRILSVTGLVIAGIATVATFRLGREYTQNLKHALKREQVDISRLKSEALTSDFFHLLPDIIVKSDKQTLLDVLELIRKDRRLSPYLLELLDHEDPDIRLKSIQILNSQNWKYPVQKMLSDADRRIRFEAASNLVLPFDSAANPISRFSVEDHDPLVQAAAWSFQLSHPNLKNREIAKEKLMSLLLDSLQSPDERIRMEVAEMLSSLDSAAVPLNIYKVLLSDPSLEVQKTALRSVAESRPAGLTTYLIRQFRHSPLLRELRQTFQSYGESLLPDIFQVLQSGTLSEKKFIIKTIHSIAGEHAVPILQKAAGGTDLALRLAALEEINRLSRERKISTATLDLEDLLDQELEGLNVEFERRSFIRPQPNSLMDRLLRQREEWAKDRIFRVLGLMYDSKTIYFAHSALQHRDERFSEAAYELLDLTLKPVHRIRVMELLEKKVSPLPPIPFQPARRPVLMAYLGARDQLPAAALICDLNDREFQIWRQEIERTLKVFSNLLLVEEALHWRERKMQNNMNTNGGLTTIEKLEKLSEVDIFSTLGPEELLVLARQCKEATFTPGECVFREGEMAMYIFCLVEGKMERRHPFGKTDVLEPGQSFGTLEALTRRPHHYTVTALEECRCLKLNHEVFLELIEERPPVATAILQVLGEKIWQFLSKIDDMEGRLAKYEKESVPL